MKFGPVPLAEAEGAVLAHSLAVEKGRVRKGKVLDAGDIDRLAAAGHDPVIAAVLDRDDVPEDAAAKAVAAALVPDPGLAGLHLADAHTGRVNVYADLVGVLEIDVTKVEALNAVDPMITLATVPPWQVVTRADGRHMVGTVKIISYAVSRASLDRAVAVAHGALRMRPVAMQRARLIVPKLAEGDKEIGHRAILKRLEALMMTCDVEYVLHREQAIAAALAASDAELNLILTASATSDPADVAPQALRNAGGRVTRFGLPVDPGNLLFLGDLGGRPVIGLPGCARSPALNGADGVMERIICGVAVSDADMAAMGVGGLLKDSPARGMPRERKS